MPLGGLRPNAVVVVATARALKYNGGVPKAETGNENLEALKKGIVNLGAHIQNMRKYGVPVVVAINRFDSDTDAELAYIEQYCKENGADFALSEVFAKGGEGGMELARKVCAAAEQLSDFHPIYAGDLPGAKDCNHRKGNLRRRWGYHIRREALGDCSAGGDALPVCIAKTQYSLSDNAALLGRRLGSKLPSGTCAFQYGFVSPCGDIMTMPGLPKRPAAERIDVMHPKNIWFIRGEMTYTTPPRKRRSWRAIAQRLGEEVLALAAGHGKTAHARPGAGLGGGGVSSPAARWYMNTMALAHHH
ncbi:MAG: formate--tetrahydrofolate ligase [Anaeromassilibacillus sp.]